MGQQSKIVTPLNKESPAADHNAMSAAKTIDDDNNASSPWMHQPRTIAWTRRAIPQSFSSHGSDSDDNRIWWPSVLWPTWSSAAKDSTNIMQYSSTNNSSSATSPSSSNLSIRIQNCKKRVKIHHLSQNMVPAKVALGKRDKVTGYALNRIVCYHLGISENYSENVSYFELLQFGQQQQNKTADGIVEGGGRLEGFTEKECEFYSMSKGVEWGVVTGLKENVRHWKDDCVKKDIFKTLRKINGFVRMEWVQAMEEALQLLGVKKEDELLLSDGEEDIVRWWDIKEMRDDEKIENATPEDYDDWTQNLTETQTQTQTQTQQTQQTQLSSILKSSVAAPLEDSNDKKGLNSGAGAGGSANAGRSGGNVHFVEDDSNHQTREKALVDTNNAKMPPRSKGEASVAANDQKEAQAIITNVFFEDNDTHGTKETGVPDKVNIKAVSSINTQQQTLLEANITSRNNGSKYDMSSASSSKQTDEESMLAPAIETSVATPHHQSVINTTATVKAQENKCEERNTKGTLVAENRDAISKIIVFNTNILPKHEGVHDNILVVGNYLDADDEENVESLPCTQQF
mmetsp:Transcript_15262/g.17547  ORF Transcript_15262/g.17547 Transcript_15262/m.17547 type:complete len:572 (-) Transcript_15262:253-1968(-)